MRLTIVDMQHVMAFYGWTERSLAPLLGTKVWPDPDHRGCSMVAGFDEDSGIVTSIDYCVRTTRTGIAPTEVALVQFLAEPQP